MTTINENMNLSNKKLIELQEFCKIYDINIKKKSEKTDKLINKKKDELIEEISKFFKNQKSSSDINESDEDHQIIVDDKEDYDNHNLCPVVLVNSGVIGEQINSLEESIDPKFNDEISEEFKKECEKKIEDYLSKDYIEKSFRVNFEFGSFIKFKDNIYIIGKNNKLIFCEEFFDEFNDLKECYIIPYEISKYLKNSVDFFGIFNNKNLEKRIKQSNKIYDHKYYDQSKGFMIYSIQLPLDDIYLNSNLNIKNIKTNIKFYIQLSKDYEYDLIIEIPYTTDKNIDKINDKYIDKVKDKIVIKIKKDLTFDKSFSEILSFQNKISEKKFDFKLHLDLPKNYDVEPIWEDNFFNNNITNYVKVHEDDSIDIKCDINSTIYDMYLNFSNIYEQYIDKINLRNIEEKVFLNLIPDQNNNNLIDDIRKQYDFMIE